jgi:ABC-type Fe3+-siderophore transport system permease subunit
MSSNLRPYLLNITLLLIALTLSIAVGAIFIRPDILMRMVLAQFPGISITPNWPETFDTIVFKIRLPHTILIVLRAFSAIRLQTHT